jgi:hypothetical protein
MGLATLPHSFADCFEIWEPQSPGTLRACHGIALPLPLPLIQTYNQHLNFRSGVSSSAFTIKSLYAILSAMRHA